MKWLCGEVVCISGQMNWGGCCAEIKLKMTVLKIGWSNCCGEVEIEVVVVKIGWSGCCGQIECIG